MSAWPTLPFPGLRRRGGRAGAALILTLWITVVLSLLAYSLLYELRLDTRLATLHKRDMQAFYVARAGLAKGVVDLTNDLLLDRSPAAQLFDSLGDVWADQTDKTDVSVGVGKYTVLVEDEESKISLNHADVKLLYGLLRVMGVEEKQAWRVAGAIVDWRDVDTKPYGGQRPYESEYYADLQMLDESGERRPGNYAYISKNDAFTTVEELLDVYGVTPELFHGRKPERRRSPRRRRDALEELERPDGTLVADDVGLRQFLTVWTTGRININTAPREVLAAVAIAGGADLPGALGFARAVQNARAEESEFFNAAFRSLNDLKARSGFAVESKLGQVSLGFLSETFTVTSLGVVNDVKHSIQVVIRRYGYGFPKHPAVGTTHIWRQSERLPPPFKKLRSDPKQGAQTLAPAVYAIQWLEW